MSEFSYTERLKKHYVPLLEQHGSSHRSVDWGSPRSQKTRLDVLLEVGNVTNSSILDVGCGIGHLASHLSKRSFQGRYLGIDVLPEMTNHASQRCPDREFQVANILSLDWRRKFDYVLGSGLFQLGDIKLVKDTVKAMYEACNKAVAFNSLSAWADQKELEEFHVDPSALLEFCRTITPNLTLRHDYLPHDFTIYMYRRQQP